MALFFAADNHFGHRCAIAMCARPNASVPEMDEGMIQLWNARVRPTDTVWHLGDFALGAKGDRLSSIFGRLHGRKCLVRGNNDHTATLELGWAQVEQIAEISGHGQKLILCHYPFRSWKGAFSDHVQTAQPGRSRISKTSRSWRGPTPRSRSVSPKPEPTSRHSHRSPSITVQ